MLLRLRTRTVGGIKVTCPVGCRQNDTLPHILRCTALRRHHKSTDISVSDCQYEDVFSENIRRQQSTTEIYKQLLEIRNEILSQPVAIAAGPMHSTNKVICQYYLWENK